MCKLTQNRHHPPIHRRVEQYQRNYCQHVTLRPHQQEIQPDPVIHRGDCIGNRPDIEAREIPGIQEGVAELNARLTKDSEIDLCHDNQDALRALVGGLTAGREYVKECLKEALTLQQNRSRVLGKWTLSHKNIPGNKQVDKLAKMSLNSPVCTWTRTTLAWTRTRPHRRIIEQWATPANPEPVTKPFPPTAKMPRQSSRAIAGIRHSLTAQDPSAIHPAGPCACGTRNTSAKQIILACPEPSTVTARTALMDGHQGTLEWVSITDLPIRAGELLKFTAITGLIRIRHVFMTAEDARDTG